jgi:hypothetical protein
VRDQLGTGRVARKSCWWVTKVRNGGSVHTTGRENSKLEPDSPKVRSSGSQSLEVTGMQ